MKRLAKRVKKLLEAIDPSVTVVECSSELTAPEYTQNFDFNANKPLLEDLHRQLARKLELRAIIKVYPNYFENQDQANTLNFEIAQLERRIEEAQG